MLTSDKVYEMAAKINGAKNEKDVETKDSKTEAKVEETKVETATTETAKPSKNEETADTDKKSESEQPKAKAEQTEESKTEETKPEVDETKSKQEKPEKSEEKKTPTKQEQIDFAFKKQKAKYKKLEERFRAIEEENKKLKSGLTLADFNNKPEDFMDYLVNKKVLEREKSRIQEEYTQARQEEFNELYEKRIQNCFPDEAERNIYNNLIRNEGRNFLSELDQEDPDGVVLGYLDDSDVQPIMLRILMTNENYKNGILSKRSPYMKLRALEDLENRIKYAQAELAKRREAVPEKIEDTKPAQPEKPAQPTQSIPVIGSVTKSDTSTGNIVKDYNSILHDLNQKRYGR